MIKIGTILLIVSMLSVSSDSKMKILFFGDSITQAAVQKDGYISQLNNMLSKNGYEDKVDLIGKGIGGNKVYDLYLRMQNDVIAQKPDIVFIYIGVNDVWHKQSFGTGTDPDKFVIFYQAIIDSLQNKGIELVLCTPGVIGEKTDYSNALDGDLNEYTNLIKALAAKNGTSLCDLRGAMIAYNKIHNTKNQAKGILTSDSVHLNKIGNKLVAETFMKIIEKKLKM
jgi:lysophospholipase L1-like esterase